jgi:putative transcriptional regulator
MMRRPKRKRHGSTVAKRVIEGLTELVEAMERGEPLEKRFTIRRVTIPEPNRYTPAKIRQTRQRLGTSQALFAMMIGVSVKLVEHWESGMRIPSPMARRLLDEINSQPDYWRRKLHAA